MPHCHRIAALAGLLLAGSAFAQSACLDQSYVPASLTNGLEVTNNQPVTQTFTCGRSGQLVQVEVSRIRHHNGVTTNPLTIDIVLTDTSGTPTTTSLATVVVQPATITTGPPAPLPIDLSAFNVQVQQGQVLGLALTSPNGPGTPSYAWWGTAPGGAYGGGQIFIQQTLGLSVWDLAFQTWVSVPATATVYGAGHAGTTGVPGIGSSAAPVLGTTPDVLIGNPAGAATLGALFLGLSQANVPTPFGGTALVVPLTSVGFAAPAAGAAVPFAIPNDGALCGFVIDMQAVLIDGGASQGLAFTPGLEFVLGD
jgi:hypothetical protein